MALRELEDGIRQLQLRLGEQGERLGEQQTLIDEQQAQLALSDPVGRIEAFAGSTPPAGWLLCDGTAVSRSTYAQLFALIGTTYGAGNGSSTFNLPNAKGRVLVGRDTAQTEFNSLGKTGGAKTHAHPLSDAGQAQVATGGSGIFQREVPTTTWTANWRVSGTQAGSSVTRSNAAALAGDTDDASSLPPYLTVNYIIRAG